MAQSVIPFWQRKTLAQMSEAEWESLCDGCGKCCLHKLEDEEDGQVYYTDVACRYLDTQRGRCMAYAQRLQKVAACIKLTPAQVDQFHWLPSTCAYRLIAENKPLPWWHPLVSGDPASVRVAGMSVAGKVVSEAAIAPDEIEERVVLWVE